MTDNELRERFHRFNRALNRADALIEEWEADRTPITRAEAAQMFSFVARPYRAAGSEIRGYKTTRFFRPVLTSTFTAWPSPRRPGPPEETK